MMVKDHFQQFMDISGRNCYVSASFVNGRIIGFACMAVSIKKMDFDFEPMKTFKTRQMLFLELKRLYLDYRMDDNGKYKIAMKVLSEEEHMQPKNDFNLLDTRLDFLAKIDGSPLKYLRV